MAETSIEQNNVFVPVWNAEHVHVGGDENKPDVILAVYWPVPTRLTEENAPDWRKKAQGEAVQSVVDVVPKLTRSILSIPVELEVTLPIKTGAFEFW